MKKTLFTLALLVALAVPAASRAAEAKDEKRQDIEKLLKLTVTDDFFAAWVRIMMQSFKDVVSAASDKEKKEITDLTFEVVETVLREQKDNLVGKVAPIYDKHFTGGEIKELIAFYESGVGRKFMKVAPALTQEAMEAGRQWGTEVMPIFQTRLRERLMEKGYLKPTEGKSKF